MNKPLNERLNALLQNTDLDILERVAEKFYQWDAADQQEAAVEQRNPDYSIADFVFDHLRKEVTDEADLTILKEQIEDTIRDDLTEKAVTTAVKANTGINRNMTGSASSGIISSLAESLMKSANG